MRVTVQPIDGAPLNYSTRNGGGSVNAQLLPGSMRLHNKIYYAEDDTGTHKAHSEYWGHRPRAATAATALLRRNFLATHAAGGNQWWMDLFNQGWYDDPAIMKEVAWQSAFAAAHIQNRQSQAEIAVFVSETSCSYDVIFPTWYMGGAIEQQINEISVTGAPYDVFCLEDLPLLIEQKRLSHYKFAIMLNAVVIDAPLADTIKKHLLADERPVLWFYMPGFIRDGRKNIDYVREPTAA